MGNYGELSIVSDGSSPFKTALLIEKECKRIERKMICFQDTRDSESLRKRRLAEHNGLTNLMQPYFILRLHGQFRNFLLILIAYRFSHCYRMVQKFSVLQHRVWTKSWALPFLDEKRYVRRRPFKQQTLDYRLTPHFRFLRRVVCSCGARSSCARSNFGLHHTAVLIIQCSDNGKA